MKKLLTILVVLAMVAPAMADFTATASVPQDFAGYDRFNTDPNPRADFTAEITNSFGSWRDNIEANGDTWLASNQGIVVKEPGGTNNGATGNPGYVGAYVGSSGDYNDWSYKYTADADQSEIEYEAALLVIRDLTDAWSRRIKMEVKVNGTTQATHYTGYWSNNPAADYYIDPTVYDPSITGEYTTIALPQQFTVSGLTIAPGDQVELFCMMVRNDDGGYGSSKKLGLGIQLVPEPATMSLLALGGLGALIRRRRS